MFRLEAEASTSRLTLGSLAKRGILLVSKLLSMAQVIPSITVSHIEITLDASQLVGAVMFAEFPSETCERLWLLSEKRRHTCPCNSSTSNPFSSSVESIFSLCNWKLAVVRKWMKHENINGLEAATCVMALNWLINRGIRSCRVVFFTDSMVALGAFIKGRSSSIPILLRCRRMAGLEISAQIRPAFLHIFSELNADDKPSRLM